MTGGPTIFSFFGGPDRPLGCLSLSSQTKDTTREVNHLTYESEVIIFLHRSRKEDLRPVLDGDGGRGTAIAPEVQSMDSPFEIILRTQIAMLNILLLQEDAIR
jgi:hypothetical protein